MPVTNSWEDEAKTILVNDFQGQWTWDEFEAGVLRGYELIKTVDHPVYVIARNFTEKHHQQPGARQAVS
jgi:hypothetical protein